MRTFEIYVHNDCDKFKDKKYTNHDQAIMICNAISAMREKRRAELNLKGPRAKHKEETMNPKKKASKCQDESLDDRIERIVEDKLEERFKGVHLTDEEWKNVVNAMMGFDVEKMVKRLTEEKGPAPELTQKENNILKGLHYLGWSWIARDDDSVLCVYETQPKRSKEPEYKEWQTDDDYMFINDIAKNTNDLFSFITWENEPMLIANLIDWSDDE